MREIEAGVHEIYVQPGEFYVVTEPTVLRTVLGSCVGVAFFAQSKGIAGFCHPMLPCHAGAHMRAMSRSHSRRYVDFAILDLLGELESLGVLRSEIAVKVFGGADVLKVVNHPSKPTVGRLNCEAALKVLREERLQIAASRLGGTSGLAIEFHSDTGAVLVRKLSGATVEAQDALSRNKPGAMASGIGKDR
ncbi:MAG TPA: chemotaxis protein CheD [Terracidiphilus sp.]|nr:chemotaxis protein CheD [Terracidiphilus sp.]